jgi:hypothetical protein
MAKKLFLALVLFALVATAGNIPTRGSYIITVGTPAVVQGNVLSPGEYKLTVRDTKVTFAPTDGRGTVEASVRVEAVDKKFSGTTVTYDSSAGKPSIAEIELGGSKTKLVFAR